MLLVIDFFPTRQVALELFGFSIHWYGLLYMAAFILAYLLLPRLQHHRGLKLNSDDWATVLTASVLGVIIGGRLGYVFFYNPSYFLAQPVEILKVWQGGMASHGGFIGVLVALFYCHRKLKISLLALADIIAVPVALGLALGRLGNFINLELYGTMTDVSWAVAIPGVEGLRHPLPIYGIIQNLLIAWFCYLSLMMHRVPGQTMAIFLIFYAVARFMLEYVREQSFDLISLGFTEISRGQLLTIPVLLAGWALLLYARHKSGRQKLP